MSNRQKPWTIYFLATATILLLIFVSLITAVRPRPGGASTPRRFSDLKELQDFVDSYTKLASLLAPVAIVNGGPGLGTIGITEKSATPTVAQPAATPTTPPAAGFSAANPSAAGAQASPDYSITNNQVAGVDEADIVKSDGSYLYVISGSKIDILAAYPPEQAQVLSSLAFDNPPVGLFVSGNRMLVIGRQEPEMIPMQPMLRTPGVAAPTIYPLPIRPPYQLQGVAVAVYDTSDKSNPKLLDSFSITGASYVASRMIGGYVYLIANTPLDLGQPQGTGQDSAKLPEIIEGNGSVTTLPASAIQYFDIPYSGYQYTMVEAYNLGAVTRKTCVFLTGATQQVFASSQNIYLASPAPIDPLPLLQKYLGQLTPLLPDSLTNQLTNPGASQEQKLQQLTEVLSMGAGTGPGNQAEITQIVSEMQHDLALTEDQTLVQKLQISGYDTAFQDQADVPGQVLNQYSMDEQDGYFRIATTTRDPEQSTNSSNNIFVYGPKLQLVGQLTGLAPGEHIYSARFLGQRAYLVTFQQVDPFFVVDLSDPASPKVLGDLKIPGFSDYLQPYDENHIIGIGKNTTPNIQESGMPLPTGLKIALFDVTNPQQPKELSRYILPDGSDSQALYDPKALLFSQSKNLLALPVTSPNNYGQYYSYWQGAYVFDISLDQGIVLKGTIEHPASNTQQTDGQVIPAPSSLPTGGQMIPAPTPYQQYGDVQRILYIGDVLYTVSDSLVKLNDINSLAELKALNL
jgi:inhibitor of cysteine peptidase